MKMLPGHKSPRYSEEARENALFHYTTGAGLLGILKSNRLWSTAYYCANDESELGSGKGVLTPIFQEKTYQMIRDHDPRVEAFASRGVKIQDLAEQFENTLLSLALNPLCVYITCFCKASREESFKHGLLSQWRGYGIDGGYALQFSRSKLQGQIRQINNRLLKYELEDVNYTTENALKHEVLKYSDTFETAYLNHLDKLLNFDFKKNNPLRELTWKALQSLLKYIT